MYSRLPWSLPVNTACLKVLVNLQRRPSQWVRHIISYLKFIVFFGEIRGQKGLTHNFPRKRYWNSLSFSICHLLFPMVNAMTGPGCHPGSVSSSPITRSMHRSRLRIICLLLFIYVIFSAHMWFSAEHQFSLHKHLYPHSDLSPAKPRKPLLHLSSASQTNALLGNGNFAATAPLVSVLSRLCPGSISLSEPMTSSLGQMRCYIWSRNGE